MMYVSPRELSDVPSEQAKLERELERPVRLWEVSFYLNVLLFDKPSISSRVSVRFNQNGEDVSMLGRVLIEVGYAEADAVEGALTLQSQERRTGRVALWGRFSLSSVP